MGWVDSHQMLVTYQSINGHITGSATKIQWLKHFAIFNSKIKIFLLTQYVSHVKGPWKHKKEFKRINTNTNREKMRNGNHSSGDGKKKEKKEKKKQEEGIEAEDEDEDEDEGHDWRSMLGC